jgi:hypothetical protein
LNRLFVSLAARSAGAELFNTVQAKRCLGTWQQVLGAVPGRCGSTSAADALMWHLIFLVVSRSKQNWFCGNGKWFWQHAPQTPVHSVFLVCATYLFMVVAD